MAEERAERIINLRDREKAKQENFRAMWQETADLQYPRDNQITDVSAPGEPRTTHIYDVTACTESMNMASGFSAELMPAGQMFFGLKASDNRINGVEMVRRYFGVLTELAHELLFDSNFMLQVNETLRSWLVFGTGNIYSEWTYKTGLNFRDYDIGRYQLLEDARGRVSTVIMTLPYTARQAVEMFGEDNLGEKVQKAYRDEKRREEIFSFIHIVQPRKEKLARIGIRSWDYESLYIDEIDKIVIGGVNSDGNLNEGGFQELPYHVPRYMKSSGEVYGRGIGTFIQPQVRVVNRMKADLIELGNRYARPPKQVLESFDGVVDVGPDATNYVQTLPSIMGLDDMTKGSFPVTQELLEFERDVIREAYFKNVFEQLSMLKGDRRTQLEIIKRLKEGLKKLSNPIGRLFAELFNPLITRTVLLLIRNGVAPQPPTELRGQGFKVEYVGPLALALREQHVRAFEYWVGLAAEMSAYFPGVTDNIDADKGIREIGESVGVKTSHIRPIRERDMVRQQREQMMAQQQALQEAEIAAKSYNQATKAPEAGSPAEKLGGR